VEIYRGIDEIKFLKNPIVTLGGFDGLHRGHRKIIDHLVDTAAKDNTEALLITFYPHPRIVLGKDLSEFSLLTTIEEKIELLEKTGIHHLLIFPFTVEFSHLTAYEFTRDFLVNKIGVSKLVIGFNHHFGMDREGNYLKLEHYAKEFGFKVEEISEQILSDVTVSSTKIRKALFTGDINKANYFLGYNFSMSGTVVHGNHLGRTIDFPTVNLHKDDPFKLIPANGVYAVKVFIGDIEKKGMTNIGIRPTLNLTEKTIETHIFDFNEDIYGKKIKISFVERLRDEIKFENIDLLKDQLKKDKKAAENFL